MRTSVSFSGDGACVLPRFVFCLQGGHTAFTQLGINVAAKAGRAVLWPSVRSNDLLRIDERTMHEATPVLKGEKYAANLWLHLYDFKTPHRQGCLTG